jgi:GTPase SAR1 family protein
MQDYLRQLGRNVWVVNLDPANEVPKGTVFPNQEGEKKTGMLPYDVLLDVCDSVINLSSVMKQLSLGPNGGLVYCMEYLEAHVEEIVEMLQERIQQELEETDRPDIYLLLDLPGQVELYTHGNAIPKLLAKIVKVLDLRLVAVQLIDAHYCTEPANFLSAALLGTTTMLKLELPAVSLLSKVDLLANYGPLLFSLDFFSDCQDLERLVPYLQQQGDFETDALDHDEINHESNLYGDDYADDPEYQRARQIKRSSPFFRKHERMHRAMAEVVGEFGLISFLPLDISSAESVGRVVARIDKCNGYVFTTAKVPNHESAAANTEDLFQVAVQSEPSNYEYLADIQERVAQAKAKERKS